MNGGMNEMVRKDAEGRGRRGKEKRRKGTKAAKSRRHENEVEKWLWLPNRPSSSP